MEPLYAIFAPRLAGPSRPAAARRFRRRRREDLLHLLAREVRQRRLLEDLPQPLLLEAAAGAVGRLHQLRDAVRQLRLAILRRQLGDRQVRDLTSTGAEKPIERAI